MKGLIIDDKVVLNLCRNRGEISMGILPKKLTICNIDNCCACAGYDRQYAEPINNTIDQCQAALDESVKKASNVERLSELVAHGLNRGWSCDDIADDISNHIKECF